MSRRVLLCAVGATIALATAGRSQPCVTEIGKPTFTLTDANIDTRIFLSKDTVWWLDQICFIEPGNTLTIEAGTILKGLPKALPTNPASSLVVRRGAKLIANGTQACPIVFTHLADDVDNQFDVAPGTRGQWGSLLILGAAPICSPAGMQNRIEGIDTLLYPAQTFYGGLDPNDSSGVYRYISLRHGGEIIGGANEINGLTLGGVGAKTVVEHIEVFHNLDDGFEFFGGTVNCSYLISAFNDDDNIDWDEGFSGAIQFFFAINDSTNGDSGGELNGVINGSAGFPGSENCYSLANVANATFIGRGLNGPTQGPALNFRVMSAGTVFNSVLTEYRGQAFRPDLLGAPNGVADHICAGRLDLGCNFWWNFDGDDGTFDNTTSSSTVVATTALPCGGTANDTFFIPNVKNNVVADPLLVTISRKSTGTLDPRPTVNLNSALEDLDSWCALSLPAVDPVFSATNFVGAFDPNEPLWTENWTALWNYGYTPVATAPLGVTIPVCTCCNLAGDADDGGDVNIGDALTIIDFIFGGPNPDPPCPAESDADGGGDTNIGDALTIIDFIFGGPNPDPICGP